ncbi:hypothetical protein GCM10011575_03860 [Microlunatus endophyticus]|uniref:Uncharacterized protein n=1 Tax=Microlunatus endophyticus TaxID=1716077 RepID=A0A917W109_9ACTN|nr:aminoglycoside phosphotransferase family protein [Microlunatus endophyticus]GGL49003.1 hypothetical protein GCM10011575_03860 [Microlunatus endophyticus]
MLVPAGLTGERAEHPAKLPRPTALVVGRYRLAGLAADTDRASARSGTCGRTGVPGTDALVLPVNRDGQAYALRLAPPDERTRSELAALDFWSGRGTVRQYASDP